MLLLLPHVLLPALVSGVSAQGIYLNEGSADGVRIGDSVQIGAQKLTIVEVGPHHARTGPPADPFAVKTGVEARVTRSGQPEANAPAGKATKLAPAPKLDPAQAPTLWAAAEDGWAAPRPFAPADGAARPKPEDEASAWRVRGDLSLTTTHIAALDGSRVTSVGTLGSDLRLARGDFRYRHDLRANGGLPVDIVSEGYPWVEARQLEVGWETETWGARGGRVLSGDRLASGPVDGAALQLQSPGDALHYGGQLYGGLEPAPDTLAPRISDRTAGLGGQVGGRAGDFRLEASAGANTVAHGTRIDRIVVGPEFLATSELLTFVAFTDLDFVPGFTLSQVYGSAYVSIGPHADVGLRYDRLDAPTFGQADAGVRQDVWLDARLDAYPGGTFSPRLGYLTDDAGDTWSPGLDYRVALGRHVDMMLGYDYLRGPWQESHLGRARGTLRLDGSTLSELDLGVRAQQIYPEAGLDADLEKTLELGAWLMLPADLDLHLYAEGTMAWQNRLVALADLRWRFGK
jgi:hypothetical protein